jgi:hypothetical protein
MQDRYRNPLDGDQPALLVGSSLFFFIYRCVGDINREFGLFLATKLSVKYEIIIFATLILKAKSDSFPANLV